MGAFRYLDRWSLTNTWLHDEPPVPGDSVVVPLDQTLLVDVAACANAVQLVQGTADWRGGVAFRR